MKVVLQRVTKASCSIDQKIYSQIKQGYVLLVGFTHQDSVLEIEKIAKKISKLRVFSDENGKMNRSIFDVNGSILSISQFTLYADTNSGNRPSFTNAMKAEEASHLYDLFNEELRKYHIEVQTGVFGADMQIELLNDGPVTIIYEEYLGENNNG